ncbi:VaFE repeat-containing surface-anchored protein [Actinomycetaceae bacterium UMB8039B]|uniref:VaFE repeat-containing surface-anchored protein n=1 Tax=Pauljensenia sp. UMB8040A TaxID=3046343 RepID=UPI00254BBF16|nr:VaFE repeat-containing surface-anchored protein [Pauljensenia sp. UMB8040A]MDK6829641.1 VaFE repeat-containing surface-anchored protein [Pauljensenia sp. UMB8040A]MDK7780546.1 VaFE repeat-containing surface-anchored protein [Actinomycetaceae bacterium UMB8041B]MDK8293009.1 VaFE repeat-containing surface-anchored protein [Actinomycetaceae bacterium UMB8039B]MDK8607906.1 VaFE repeat-containing surface-anchored protein [Actinomycetaceae bacterium UMB8041A]
MVVVCASLTALAPASVAAGSWVRGVPIAGLSGWLGTWIPYSGQPVPGLCIQADAVNPAAEVVVTPGQLTVQPSLSRPADLSVDIAQMAYIMKWYTPTSLEFSNTDVDAAATAFLAHVNFENSRRAQANVNTLLASVPESIQSRARQMVAEAKAAGVVGWKPGTVTGERMRFGTIDGIGVTNADGTLIAGKPFTITLNGPAVFEATGTNTYTGTTTASRIDGIQWRSTANGTVHSSIKYDNLGYSALGYASSRGVRQDVIWFDSSSLRSETVAGPSFEVIFDFQPIATSNVGSSKVIDSQTLSDTITASADPNYGDGKWLEIDGEPVPVVYEGTAYALGEEPVDPRDEVPADAHVVATASFTATGPGEHSVNVDVAGLAPGFYTWVWKVVKDAQPGTIGDPAIDIKELVHADWHDQFGLGDETLSYRFKANVDTSLSVRTTKSGSYLVDDMFVTEMPESHPNFTGKAGFKGDELTFTQKLVFFPEGQAVTDENVAAGETISEVQVDASHGFKPSVGSTGFKMKDGEPGTYVFVTSFAGDDRVAPFTTSVTDKSEQYVVEANPPTLKTTATDKADGDKTLASSGLVTITDKVCYTNLKQGREYTLSGTLMDKATGGPLMIEGKPVTASKTFTPSQADGCENVDFTIDGSMVVGKTTVVFERLEHDGQTIAVHTDINDEDQTVLFEKTPTPPEEHLAKTGAQTLSFLAGATLFALMGVGAIALHRRS